MIGNNACGAHSLAFGKTDANVTALEVLTYGGERLTLSTLEALGRAPGATAATLAAALSGIAARYGADIAAAYPPGLARRVSGYNLPHLLAPGGNLAAALVGSEGTLVTVLEATVRLVPAAAARALAVFGFPDVYTAAEFVPEAVAAGPLTLEGLDARLVALGTARADNRAGTALLPPGGAWLLAEVGGADEAEAAAEAAALVAGLPARGVVVTGAAAQAAVWRLREDGAGLATRLEDGGEAWPGWEDAAVPPERLADYLRDFDRLLAEHGRRGVHYGHYGEGCVHIRIDFDFTSAAGVAGFRRFIEDAADLVAAYGGSLSGEHGDGQARAELLGKIYPRPVLDAFAALKAAFDPRDGMNPGHLVSPRPIDTDLRVRPGTPAVPTRLALSADHGDLAAASRRCVGVGRCRRLDGGAMCPSFQATRAEQHSTRGRARLLQEMVGGDLLGGFSSKEVLAALDLCLSCKACKRECPVGVDMAAYKTEFLARHYARRLRPRQHYSLGGLPRSLRLARRAPRLFNLLTRGPQARVLKRLGGLAPERSLPRLAPRQPVPITSSGAGPPVLLWPDTFTATFAPGAARAAAAVAGALGIGLVTPPPRVCCGLTWYSTGRLTTARRVLRRSLSRLGPELEDAAAVLVLEPSCAAMLRDEAPELLPGDPRAAALAAKVRSIGELVAESGAPWPFSPLTGEVVAQVHCHQHASTGYGEELALLSRLGLEVTAEVACCGMAGNFGFEPGHFEVSAAIARRGVLRHLGGGDRLVVADGFSCRTQIAELSNSTARHLAEVLASAL